MYYPEKEARELIIQAGYRLLKTGLIARTWGNISARISENQYIITPSGMAYDTLRPEQLVKVNLNDGVYEGCIKPSGEKAVHAAVYQLKPEVSFIVHTHQVYASVIGVTGKDLSIASDSVLGDVVPCAAYGMPSSQELCRNVETAIRSQRKAKAVLMMHHGAICMGDNPEEAFQVAERLEEVCREMYQATILLPEQEQRFQKCTIQTEAITCLTGQAPGAGVLETSYEVLQLANRGKTIEPYLDDLAQIAGPTIRCTSDFQEGLHDRDAVLVPGEGAYCVGPDAEAVAMILAKEAKTQLYAEAVGGCQPLTFEDASQMRHIYVHAYSRQKVTQTSSEENE